MSVIVRTPCDVRTFVLLVLVHAFLVVYDGDFLVGEFVVMVRLRFGRTWTQWSLLGF